MKRLLFFLLATLFAMQCNAQTAASIPWTCNFEDPTENANWTFDNGSCTNQWVIGAAATRGVITGNALYISDDGGTSYHYTVGGAGAYNVVIATRKIESSGAGGYMLSFDWRCGGESTWDFFRVFLVDESNTSFVSSNTSGASGYANNGFASRNALGAGAIAGVVTTNPLHPTNSNILNGYTTAGTYDSATTHHINAELPSMGAAGTIKKLIIVWRQDGSGGTALPASLDNFSISPVACPSPSGLAVPTTTLTSTEAVVNWAALTEASEYVIQWKKSAVSSWDDPSVGAATSATNTYTITNLAPMTPHNVRVRTVCTPATDSSMSWTTTDFLTACADINTFPYTENFDVWGTGTSVLPACWTKHTNYSSYPYVAAATTPPSSPNALYFYVSSSGHYNMIVLPKFAETVELNHLKLQFWLRSNNTTNNMIIGAMTDPTSTSTFIPIDTVSLTATNTWQQFELYLSNYTGSAHYVAFRYEQSAFASLYLDDIFVDYVMDYDLQALSVTPNNLIAGHNQVPYVNIKNRGVNAVTGSSYTVTVSDGAGYSQTVQGEDIAPETEIALPFPTYSQAATGSYTLTATINYSADEDVDNNSATCTGTVYDIPTYPHNAYTLNTTNGTYYAFDVFTSQLTPVGTTISNSPYPVSETWIGTGTTGQGDGMIARILEDGSFGYVLSNGAFVKIGNMISPVSAIPSTMAYNKNDGVLYIMGYTAGVGSTITNYLGTLNLETLEVTPVGSSSNSDNLIMGMDFDDNGYLYGVSLNGSSDLLYLINTSTGAVSSVGDLGIDIQGYYYMDLAYDAITQKFYTYTITGGGVKYGSIDKSTGAFTEISPVTANGQYSCLTIISNTLPLCEQPTNVQASTIEHTTATITWDGLINAPDNGYQYFLSTLGITPTEDSVPTASTVDTFLNLSNLIPSTTYYVWVRSHCALGASLWSNFPAQFTTTAMAPASLPYTTGFAAADDVSWSFTNASTNKWHIGSTSSGSPAVTDGMYISNNDGATNNYTTGSSTVSWAYKAFNFTESAPYGISFNWRANGESTWDYIRAFLVPTGYTFTTSLPAGYETTNAFNNQTPAGWIDLNGNAKLNLSSTVNAKNSIAEVPAGYYYLVFLWANDGSGGSQPPAWIDNLNISAPVTCQGVSNIAASNVTHNTATLTWNEANPVPANGYQYYHSTSSVVPNADSQPTGTVTGNNLVDLQNLTPSTSYYVWVRSDCGGTYSPWAGVCTFATACAPVTIPWSADFTGLSNASFPACWFRYNNNAVSTTYPRINTSNNGSTDSPSGSPYMYFNTSNSLTLVSPVFENDVNQSSLSFYINREGPSSGTFSAGYLATPYDPASFVALATFDDPEDIWTQHAVTLTDVPNGIKQIAFRQNQVSSAWYYWLDDITVNELSDANDILTFSFAEQLEPATIDASNHTVNITVSFDSDLSALVPTITVSPMATVSPESGVEQNFSAPVTYTVTAENGSTQVWTVNVTLGQASSEKEILTFNIPNSISTTINHEDLTVAVLMPWITTNITALIPTITVSPFAAVSPASGVAANFTDPVTYTVTAQDASSVSYTVTVTVQSIPKMAIPYSQDFEDLDDVSEINYQNTAVNKWVIGSAAGNPGNSLYISNNDGTTNTYTGTPMANPTFSSTFIILDFDDNIHGEPYAQHTISFDWRAQGESATWDFMQAFIVPFDMPVPASRPTTDYNYDPWMTGEGVIKLSNPAAGMHGVFGQSSTWQTFSTDIVGPSLSGLKKLLFIWWNDGYTDVQPPAAIDNISITGSNCAPPSNFAYSDLTPFSAELTWDALGATSWNLKITNEAINPATEPGTIYDGQVTENSYSATLMPNTTYHAYVQMDCGSAWSSIIINTPDGCATPINLAVNNIAPHSATITWNGLGMTNWDIKISTTQLADPSTAEADVLDDGEATLTAAYNASALPVESNLYVYVRSNCGATQSPWVSTLFTTPCEGISQFPLVENFDNPAYTTGAGNFNIPCWYRSNPYSSNYPYVSATTPASSPNALCHYVTSGLNNYSLIVTPYLNVPLNTLITDFKVNNNYFFSIGNKLDVLAIGNLSDPATYTVVQTISLPQAADFTSYSISFDSYAGTAAYIGYKFYNENYLASGCYMDDIVVRLPSDENDILTFSLEEQVGAATINTTDHTVSIEVSYITGLTALAPTITVSPFATISPESGETQNFATPVTYTVTSETGIPQTWTVTVTNALSPEKNILTFNIPNQVSSNVNSTAHTVNVLMPESTQDVTALVPTITVSPLATVSPTSGTPVDFTNPATYTVTAQDNTTANYVVTVTIQTPICEAPTGVAANSITSTSANISWTAGDDETEWQVAWKETAGTAWSYETTTSTSYALNALTPEICYDVMVKAVCSPTDSSVWSATVNFCTPQMSCNAPTNLTASSITDHSITITWQPENGETKWKVSWRKVNADNAGSGDAQNNDYTGYPLTELVDSTEYQICVKAVCAPGVESDSICINVTTLKKTGIDDITLSNSLQLYPNPTTGELRIKNYELREGDKIEVYNILGQTQPFSIFNSQFSIIDVSHLSAGIYTVKIGGYVGKFVKR